MEVYTVLLHNWETGQFSTTVDVRDFYDFDLIDDGRPVYVFEDSDIAHTKQWEWGRREAAPKCAMLFVGEVDKADFVYASEFIGGCDCYSKIKNLKRVF